MEVKVSLFDTIKERLKFLLPYLIVFVYGVVLYVPTIKYKFALDDKISIINNKFTKMGIAGIPDIITHDYFFGFFGEKKELLTGERYRPLSLVMFAIEWEFFKDNPMPYHLINVILYGITGVVLYLLLNLIFNEGGKPWYKRISFLTTVLYLSHPVHVEVVANIKSRDEILSFLFALLAHYSQWKKNHIGSGFLFLLSLLAKESSITYLPMIGLSYYLFRERDWRKVFFMSLPSVIAFIIYTAMRLIILGIPTITPVKELLNDPYLGATGEQKYATIAYVMLLYIKLLIFPHPLTHDYYPFYIKWTTWSNPLSLISVIIYGFIVSVILQGLFQKKKSPYIVYSFLLHVMGLSLYTNIFFSIGSFANERFLWIASLGYCIFVPYLLFSWKIKEKIGWIIYCVMVLGYTFKTYERSPAWYDDDSLALTDVKISVGSAKVNMSAGLSSLKIGREIKDSVECCKLYVRPHAPCPLVVIGKDTINCCNKLGADTANCPTILKQDSIRRRYWFEQAKNFGITSLQIYPTYSHAMVVLGNAYYELNYLDSAILWFKRCLEINPQFSDCLSNIEAASDKARDIGKYELAHIGYSALLKVKKDDAKIYAKAGELAGRYLGKMDEAYKLIHEGLKLDTSNLDLWTKMGVVYGHLGKYDSALYCFFKVLSRSPEDANTLLNIGVTYQKLGNQELFQKYINEACNRNPLLCHQQTATGK